MSNDEGMNEKRFCVVVFDDKVIHGFAVLDLQKPDSRCRLKYDSVYIGSKEECEIVCRFGNSLADENEELKQEIEKLQNDTLLTELQMKCDKKQEHIVVLENKIRRMREQIKKLEGLYHYRGYIGSGDVKKECYKTEKLYDQLKAEFEKLKHRHGLLHDECVDAECERDSLKKDVKLLEKENEQLKSILKEIVRVSEYNGAISRTRVKSMTYNFIGDVE